MAEPYRPTPVGRQVEIVLDSVALPCVDAGLSLDETYRGVTF